MNKKQKNSVMNDTFIIDDEIDTKPIKKKTKNQLKAEADANLKLLQNEVDDKQSRFDDKRYIKALRKAQLELEIDREELEELEIEERSFYEVDQEAIQKTNKRTLIKIRKNLETISANQEAGIPNPKFTSRQIKRLKRDKIRLEESIVDTGRVRQSKLVREVRKLQEKAEHMAREEVLKINKNLINARAKTISNLITKRVNLLLQGGQMPSSDIFKLQPYNDLLKNFNSSQKNNNQLAEKSSKQIIEETFTQFTPEELNIFPSETLNNSISNNNNIDNIDQNVYDYSHVKENIHINTRRSYMEYEEIYRKQALDLEKEDSDFITLYKLQKVIPLSQIPTKKFLKYKEALYKKRMDLAFSKHTEEEKQKIFNEYMSAKNKKLADDIERRTASLGPRTREELIKQGRGFVQDMREYAQKNNNAPIVWDKGNVNIATYHDRKSFYLGVIVPPLRPAPTEVTDKHKWLVGLLESDGEFDFGRIVETYNEKKWYFQIRVELFGTRNENIHKLGVLLGKGDICKRRQGRNVWLMIGAATIKEYMSPIFNNYPLRGPKYILANYLLEAVGIYTDENLSTEEKNDKLGKLHIIFTKTKKEIEDVNNTKHKLNPEIFPESSYNSDGSLIFSEAEKHIDASWIAGILETDGRFCFDINSNHSISFKLEEHRKYNWPLIKAMHSRFGFETPLTYYIGDEPEIADRRGIEDLTEKCKTLRVRTGPLAFARQVKQKRIAPAEKVDFIGVEVTKREELLKVIDLLNDKMYGQRNFEFKQWKYSIVSATKPWEIKNAYNKLYFIKRRYKQPSIFRPKYWKYNKFKISLKPAEIVF